MYLLPDERSEQNCTQRANTFPDLNPSYIVWEAWNELSECVGVLSALSLTSIIRQKADSETNAQFLWNKPSFLFLKYKHRKKP